MQKPTVYLTIAAAILMPHLLGSADVLDGPELKKIVEAMGYECKYLNEEKGKEKFEFTIKKDGFDVPLAAEVSGSKNYVWFTVFLGKPPTDAAKHTELLKENFKIQPDNFYITEKGNLMIGIAVDNRGITATIVKRVTDKLSDDVVTTSKIWQGPE